MALLSVPESPHPSREARDTTYASVGHRPWRRLGGGWGLCGLAVAVLLVLYPLSIAPVAIAYQRCTGAWPELGTADYNGVTLEPVAVPLVISSSAHPHPGYTYSFPRRSRVFTTLYWPILHMLTDSSGQLRGSGWNYLLSYCGMWGLTTNLMEYRAAYKPGSPGPVAPLPPPGYLW
ncbi:hypothetical protein DB346_13705 [Verrucomicrobia bacterium LW23]|nr:hypothetical protein DB346_13705 [Verrucomicrobia bacterium LW23]